MGGCASVDEGDPRCVRSQVQFESGVSRNRFRSAVERQREFDCKRLSATRSINRRRVYSIMKLS